MPKKVGEYTHQITVKVEKGITNLYVGQVVEIPGIIVPAQTKEKVFKELQKSFDLFVEAFPQGHGRIFHTDIGVEYRNMDVTVPMTQ